MPKWLKYKLLGGYIFFKTFEIFTFLVFGQFLPTANKDYFFISKKDQHEMSELCLEIVCSEKTSCDEKKTIFENITCV